jgi:uncharacterized repeat protein (TIGR03803 family)
MKIDRIRPQTIGLLLALWLGCLRASAQTVEFSTLHSLVYTNGINPAASLILSGGVLYGTTQTGGENGYASGDGSVFRLNNDGSGYSAVRVFTNGPDGYNLSGSLVSSGNTIYGPALFGGNSSNGTLFGVNTNGTIFTNLFSFPATGNNFPYTNGPGAYPQAGLILSGNTLYGMANSGGTVGWGTIFAINTNGGSFTNLHNFAITDGQNPTSPLLLSGGTLYGSTPDGGTNAMGTLFKLSTNGAGFTSLYSFSYRGGYPYTNSDGANPLGALILAGNSLYGTASDGGTNSTGTIFAINTDGSGFTTLHQFGGLAGTLQTNSDGANPQSGLLLYGSTLYGTAVNGGQFGNGTLFRLNLDGSGFSAWYHFTDTNNAAGTNADGAHPIGGLIQSGSVLYGTANVGGTGGCGTVFSLLVPPPLNITQVGTNAIVSWAPNVSGFNLQSATNLVPPVTWSAISGQYAVTNPMTGKLTFFRLTHP